jgi:glyoxylase-like metal-dependent hydrolase (beta-lactamase superfamily II)
MAKQIVPGVHYFTGLMAGRVYLIEGEEGLTIVDAGLALAPAKIVRQLEEMGYKAGDVKRILVTHAHPDHVGGLPELKRLTGAQVVASEIEKPVVEGGEPMVRPNREDLSGISRLMAPAPAKVTGTPVDQTVTDEDTIPNVLGGLVVLATPGHSPGHISFWSPERRILFGGDVLFNIFGLRLPPAVVTVDMEEDKRSVARLTELDAQVACFGHGPALVQGTSEALRAVARKVGAI